MEESKRVLIIDDDKAQCRLYQTVLEGEGFGAEVAYSGEAAITLLEKGFRPALILLDFSMPTMSGEEFLVALEKRLPEVLRTCRVVGISAFAKESPFIEPFEKRLIEFIEKPESIDDFIGLLRRYLAA